MGWWTEYASRNSSICGQNFFLEIAVFRDGGSTLYINTQKNRHNFNA